jgi:hypothetical protein
MQNEKIIVISDPGSSVREELQTRLRLQARFEVCHLDADEKLESTLPGVESNTIIYDCPLLDKYELAVLLKISQIKPLSQVIVLADQISLFSYRKISALKNAVTMQKPLQLPLLKALVQKSMDGEKITSERSPRFIIDEFVRVLAVKTGLLLPTRMRNYSASGAFLEYHGIALNVGDTIKMNLGHPGIDKEVLEVQAKVVWIREGESPRSPTRGIGVQFLSS